jgi:guanine nucleotide-binding protein G(I)/G(S)/G(T) subunit beta-1
VGKSTASITQPPTPNPFAAQYPAYVDDHDRQLRTNRPPSHPRRSTGRHPRAAARHDMADQNESVQQRIQIARRDAEALKDRIKRKKDELADTSRESIASMLAVAPLRTVCSVSGAAVHTNVLPYMY